MFRFVVVLLLASMAQATTFSNCDDLTVNGPPALSVEVVGCAEEPCFFVRGESITAKVKFTTLTATKTVRSTVRADAVGVIVDYPLPQPDACTSLQGAECPLVAKETATYVLNMPILNIYPKINLRVEHTLTGDNGPLSCFWIRGQVVDPEDLPMRKN